MSLHRHAQITDNDHGPLVNIASWTLMCVSVLFTSFRLISNVVLRGQVVKDDWAILVATTFAVAQSIASSFMVANGLGRHQKTLSDASILGYQRVSPGQLDSRTSPALTPYRRFWRAPSST
jgi:hypothetical protein